MKARTIALAGVALVAVVVLASMVSWRSTEAVITLAVRPWGGGGAILVTGASAAGWAAACLSPVPRRLGVREDPVRKRDA